MRLFAEYLVFLYIFNENSYSAGILNGILGAFQKSLQIRLTTSKVSSAIASYHFDMLPLAKFSCNFPLHVALDAVPIPLGATRLDTLL